MICDAKRFGASVIATRMQQGIEKEIANVNLPSEVPAKDLVFAASVNAFRSSCPPAFARACPIKEIDGISFHIG